MCPNPNPPPLFTLSSPHHLFLSPSPFQHQHRTKFDKSSNFPQRMGAGSSTEGTRNPATSEEKQSILDNAANHRSPDQKELDDEHTALRNEDTARGYALPKIKGHWSKRKTVSEAAAKIWPRDPEVFLANSVSLQQALMGLTRILAETTQQVNYPYPEPISRDMVLRFGRALQHINDSELLDANDILIRLYDPEFMTWWYSKGHDEAKWRTGKPPPPKRKDGVAMDPDSLNKFWQWLDTDGDTPFYPSEQMETLLAILPHDFRLVELFAYFNLCLDVVYDRLRDFDLVGNILTTRSRWSPAHQADFDHYATILQIQFGANWAAFDLPKRDRFLISRRLLVKDGIIEKLPKRKGGATP